MSNYQTELISNLSYDQDQTNIQQSDTEILSLLFPQNKPAFGGGLGDGFSSSTPYNGRAASQSKDEGLSMLSNFFLTKSEIIILFLLIFIMFVPSTTVYSIESITGPINTHQKLVIKILLILFVFLILKKISQS